ncbi:MAG: PQQ-like beta-propeller repeat protein [Bacteroidales bacterium]|nr:PQQ-like beta-propeller repeat protein [Bacteroidales bacterium]MCF8457522.1 PQQ-like beta-propeller repeat protein [Bacteroidales bacterium]
MNYRISTALLFAILVSTLPVSSQELAQWRGDMRDGVYNETGLLKTWPKTGPEVLWASSGFGTGFSSVVVTDDMIFTTGAEDSLGYAFGLDKQGKHLWKTYFGKEWTISFPGTRTTPTFYKGKLFLHSSLGMAVCLDAKTGKILWQDDLDKKYKVRMPKWGISEAPLVYGNMVVFTPGGEDIVMLAKDVNSGETLWESKLNGDKQAYNSPRLITHNGRQMILTCLSENIVAVDPETGKLIWSHPQVNRYSVQPNTPLYKDGYVYSLTGYGVGGVMLKLSEDGSSVTEVWKCETQDNQMGGAIWVHGNIYASGQKNTEWQCVDEKTGKVKKEIDELSKGTCIFADGMIYAYGDKGELGLIQPSPEGMKLISQCDVELGTEQHWAHLVIKDGILYCRHGDTVIAYDIKKK